MRAHQQPFRDLLFTSPALSFLGRGIDSVLRRPAYHKSTGPGNSKDKSKTFSYEEKELNKVKLVSRERARVEVASESRPLDSEQLPAQLVLYLSSILTT